MYFRGLHHSAAGSGKPPKPRCNIKQTYWSASFTALTNAFKRLEVFFYFNYIYCIIKRPEPILIQAIHTFKKLCLFRIKDDPHVEKFFTFYHRYHADNSVFK